MVIVGMLQSLKEAQTKPKAQMLTCCIEVQGSWHLQGCRHTRRTRAAADTKMRSQYQEAGTVGYLHLVTEKTSQ